MSKRHDWDILEDLVVCSHTLMGDVNTKKVRNAICKEFGIDANQLKARANNFKYLMDGNKSFWHTSYSERKAFELMIKHRIVISII